MESPKAKMKVYLGEFPVIQCRNNRVTIDLGGSIHVTMHMAGLPTTLVPGDKLPLFTLIPYNPEPLDAVFVGTPKQ